MFFFKSCLGGRWKTAYQTDTGDSEQGQEISLAMISAEHMVPPDVRDQGYHSLDYQSVVNPQKQSKKYSKSKEKVHLRYEFYDVPYSPTV